VSPLSLRGALFDDVRVAQEAAGCNVTVGIYAIYGPQAAYKAWNATFEQYLATELYPQFNCTFTIVPLLTETVVYNAVGNATIDLIYSNSGMHVCLEVSLTYLLYQAYSACLQQRLLLHDARWHATPAVLLTCCTLHQLAVSLCQHGMYMHSPGMPQSCCRFAGKHHELQGCKAVICMPQEQYQVASMASLISWQANADAVSYGAAIVTLANRTDINTLQDVVGKTVS